MAFTTTTQIAQLAEKELGHDTSAASTQRDAIVDWIDYGNKIILSGGDLLNVDDNGKRKEENIIFNFARSATPKTILLRPAITDKTVTITRTSTTLTFDSAPDGASNSVAGWHVRINEEPELYYISAHTANATTATIEGGYVGPANASASTCKLIKLRYDVGSSDILRLISPIQGFESDNNKERQVSITSKEELDASCPPDVVSEGFPAVAGVVKENAGTYTLQFDSYPTDYELLNLDYIAIPTTVDTTSNNPSLPARFRSLLAYLACYYLGTRNNDNRVGQWLKIAQNMFRDMVIWDQNNIASTDKDYSKVKIKGFGGQQIVSLTQKAYT